MNPKKVSTIFSAELRCIAAVITLFLIIFITEKNGTPGVSSLQCFQAKIAYKNVSTGKR